MGAEYSPRHFLCLCLSHCLDLCAAVCWSRGPCSQSARCLKGSLCLTVICGCAVGHDLLLCYCCCLEGVVRVEGQVCEGLGDRAAVGSAACLRTQVWLARNACTLPESTTIAVRSGHHKLWSGPASHTPAALVCVWWACWGRIPSATDTRCVCM